MGDASIPGISIRGRVDLDRTHHVPGQSQGDSEYTLDAALAKAAETAGPKDLICIAGSLYLVGEARKKLLGELI